MITSILSFKNPTALFVLSSFLLSVGTPVGLVVGADVGGNDIDMVGANVVLAVGVVLVNVNDGMLVGGFVFGITVGTALGTIVGIDVGSRHRE